MFESAGFFTSKPTKLDFKFVPYACHWLCPKCFERGERNVLLISKKRKVRLPSCAICKTLK